MNEDILPYLDQEFRFLARLAGENGELARALGVDGDSVDDPHAARILKGVALLSARIRSKLDDMFPELSETMLETLNPALVAPVPSMSVLQFIPAPDHEGRATIPKGAEVVLSADAGDARAAGGGRKTWRFRTGSAVEILPIAVAETRYVSTPHPRLAPRGARSFLRLRLASTSEKAPLSAWGPARLRFHIRAETNLAYKIHELCMKHVVCATLSAEESPSAAQELTPASVAGVGFGPDDLLTPLPSHMPHLHAMLSEYFAFPTKHLGFEAGPLHFEKDANARSADLVLHFDRAPPLDADVAPDAVRLFCTPIINLFDVDSERTAYSDLYPELFLKPRDSADAETFCVRSVHVEPAHGKGAPFALPHFLDAARDGGFWKLARRRRTTGEGDDAIVQLSRTSGDKAKLDGALLWARMTCMDRIAPEANPANPRLLLSEASSAVGSMRAVAPFSPLRRRPAGPDAYWRLISHLSLNHASLSVDAPALQSILRLHCRDAPADSAARIERILRVTARPSTARAPADRRGPRIAFVSGADVDIVYADEELSGSGGYLLLCAVENFLAHHSGVNSFVRTNVTRENGSTLAAWPARAGSARLV